MSTTVSLDIHNFLTSPNKTEALNRLGAAGTATATEDAAGLMPPVLVLKMAGIAEGATANATDAALRDRALQTGQMPLGGLAGSGAAIGETLHWNGAAWVPGTEAEVLEEVVLGAVSGGTGGATGVTLSFFMPANHLDGPVKGVSVEITTVGDRQFFIQHVRETAPGVFTVVSTWSVLSGVTANTTYQYTAGVDFPAVTLAANEHIALQNKGGGAQFRFQNGSGSGYRVFVGNASGAGVAYSLTDPGVAYYQVMMYKKPDSVVVRVPTRTVDLEITDSWAAAPGGWTATGWSFAGGMATATAAGLANQLRSGRRYGLARRAIQWAVKLGDASNVIAFLTNPVEGGIQAGSMVVWNAGAGTLAIHGAYTGANSPTALLTQALNANPAVGENCLLTMENDGRQLIITLESLAGPCYCRITRAAAPVGYSVHPAFGYDQGAMQGAPGIAWVSGGATGPSVYGPHRHMARGSRFPKVYFLGDSEWENFGVTDAQGLAALAAAELGVDQVHVSAIGGAVTGGALGRLLSELVVMRPEWVVIYLGSNTDASFAAGLAALVAAAKAAGAKVAVCTVPAPVGTSAARTADVLALPGDVRKIRFDLSHTTAGAGTALVASLYTNTDAASNPYNDGLHDNADGKEREFRRLKLDLPELFR